MCLPAFCVSGPGGVLDWRLGVGRVLLRVDLTARRPSPASPTVRKSWMLHCGRWARQVFSGRWGLLALIGLAVYYGVQATVRIMTGEACQLDEAEQILLSQEWHWGYGSQGPLYTWLVRLLPVAEEFQVGRLAVLKNLLLYGTHVFVYLLSRRVLRSETSAAAVTLSLFLIPGFVYESQRDQSHLVLATCLGAAVVWVLARVVAERRPVDYLLLGLLGAGAVLSKYNTLVLLAGGAISVAFTPAARRAFRTPWSIAGLAVFAVALAPHLFWAWAHPDLLVSQSHKLGVGAVEDPWARGVTAAGRWLVCLGAYVTVPVVFLVLLRRPVGWASDGRDQLLARLIGNVLAVTLVLSGLAAIGAGTVLLKPRWFQPVMILLPLWVSLFWLTVMRSGGWRRVGWVSVVAALAGFVGVHTPVWGAAMIGRPNNLNVRYDRLVDQIRAEGFDGGLIISDDRRLAGNLLREMSGSVAVVPNLDFFCVPRDAAAVIVWDASKGADLPERLRRFAAAWVLDWPCHQPSGIAEAPGDRGDPRVTRLGFLLVPSEDVATSWVCSGEDQPRLGRKKGKTTSATVTRRKTVLTRAFMRKKARLTQSRLRRRAMRCSRRRQRAMTPRPAQ